MSLKSIIILDDLVYNVVEIGTIWYFENIKKRKYVSNYGIPNVQICSLLFFLLKIQKEKGKKKSMRYIHIKSSNIYT